MPNPPRKIAFVTVATDHGTLIVNRFDYHRLQADKGYGVGFQLLETGAYEPAEAKLISELIDLRHHYYGDGVVALDCGANIGVHTINWAKRMAGWGIVIAIEAQERLYYALAGNIAINNCFNARAIHAAIASQAGTMKMPKVNYLAPASFGSLELKKREGNEFIGQQIDYSETQMVDVPTVSLDSLELTRVDLIKMDVEGMELEALAGGAKCVPERRPLLVVETIKTDKIRLQNLLENLGYAVFENGMNVLAVHKSDRCLEHITVKRSS
jgi:FkbM family methyltransferase